MKNKCSSGVNIVLLTYMDLHDLRLANCWLSHIRLSPVDVTYSAKSVLCAFTMTQREPTLAVCGVISEMQWSPDLSDVLPVEPLTPNSILIGGMCSGARSISKVGGTNSGALRRKFFSTVPPLFRGAPTLQGTIGKCRAQ